MQTQILYLQHILQEGIVALDPFKIQAIKYWPSLNTIEGMHKVLGLSRFYRKYVHNYATIAQPFVGTRVFHKSPIEF